MIFLFKLIYLPKLDLSHRKKKLEYLVYILYLEVDSLPYLIQLIYELHQKSFR